MLKDVTGIVLKERDYGESSKILDVFTREYGLIGVISKGSKKMKSNLSGVSTRLTYGVFHIYYKEDKLSTLTSVDVLNPFINIKKNIINISFATYLSELIFQVVKQTIKSLKKIYFYPKDDLVKSDLWRMVNTFTAIANHESTNLDIGQTSIGDFAKFMRAPHRMDLMISSMEKDGKWHCNQKCIHCYAGKQEYATTQELSTKQWRKVIDICKKNCIAQLTFTGGEPTLRDDLVELINYSRWFVTKLNTNGVLLTEDLCKKLYEASLDSVQVTLYSNNKEIHNKLVGADNFDLTVQGIKNAISSGLNVSINTPLCSLNKDYVSTLKFAKELGITYASSSGLIVTGKAKEEESVSTQLSKEEITNI